MIVVNFMVAILLSYLLGAIPFGLLVSRRSAKVDIRKYGSGKTGTTNVLRTAGKKAAILVLVLDLLKGTLAVTLAGLIVGRNYLLIGDLALGMITVQVAAAVAAMVGHNWSIFLKFRGGRGVATFFGGLAALSPIVALFGGEIVFMGAVLTRFVSLGSIAGAIAAYMILVPLTIMNGFPLEYLLYAFIGTVTIIIMHRDNIARLISGKERKIGEPAEQVVSPLSERE
ncbi:MAG: glycerol-3-phosphate 1-O-acyltransferase PlsY [Dehalococcoidales bacterium]|nr:glycerol-3-phosphate 1-O-acyltransferase PlsY [Dehalococcoidales bacterium]